MTIRKPRDLTNGLTRNARLLGLDLGTKTIGLALSDVGHCIATPYDTIRRSKLAADLRHLKKVIEDEGAGALVLGLPVNMDGSEGPRCQATRQFAARAEVIDKVAAAVILQGFLDFLAASGIDRAD
jgi:putative Holliday junction resolvase